MTPRQMLDQLAEQNLKRSLKTVETKGCQLILDRRKFWNFSSNDYLGLSQHQRVTEEFVEGIKRFGAGATASRLITGSHAPHRQLEDFLAEAKHSEAALTFTSGFSTALSSIPLIVGKNDYVILDRLAHACLIDAARMSEANLRIFPHNDFLQLEKILLKVRTKHPSSRILVVTESIFSMDGDLCPLREIIEVCEESEALLFLDEAHAIGLLGATGMGLAEQLGLQKRIPFQMGTLSKAVGLSGGYLACSRDWIEWMINRARPFIYTTAPPPALAHAALVALQLIRSTEGLALRDQLFTKITILKPHHPSAILPYIFKENEITLSAAEALRAQGFLVPAIRFPTVPRNTARLRVTVSAQHPQEVILKLRHALDELCV